MAKPKASAAEPAAVRRLRITLVRSPLGNTVRHKATVRALGLRRLRHTVEQVDTPQLRGMIKKIWHLVEVEELA